MAQVLPSLTQQGAASVSPASGAQTPGSAGGKLSRTAAKKEFRNEVERLVNAVKLIPVYSDALAQLKRGDKLAIAGPNGAIVAQLGRQEFNEFVRETVKGIQSLTSLAFRLNKTRRRTAANSGFLAPARFTDEIVQFFRQANIGPIVNGGFVERTDRSQNPKMIPESKSLTPQQGSRLNDLLYFTSRQINGQPNPLYGIISPGTLTPLFALHAYYTNMQVPGDNTVLRASNEMRQLLPQTIAATIRNDQSKVQTGESRTVFNPDAFPYAHFSKIISAAKAAEPNALTDEQLAAIRPQIAAVYGNVMGNAFTGAANPEQVVLQAQQNAVALARAAKNQVQGKIQREARAERKRRDKAAAQQQQQQMGGLMGGLPQVGASV